MTKMRFYIEMNKTFVIVASSIMLSCSFSNPNTHLVRKWKTHNDYFIGKWETTNEYCHGETIFKDDKIFEATVYHGNKFIGSIKGKWQVIGNRFIWSYSREELWDQSNEDAEGKVTIVKQEKNRFVLKEVSKNDNRILYTTYKRIIPPPVYLKHISPFITN